VYAYAKDASYVNLNVTVDFVPHQEVSTRKEESAQDHQDDNAEPGVEVVSTKEDTGRQDQDDTSRSELSTKEDEKKRDQLEKNAKSGDGEASGGSFKLPPNPRMKMRMQFFCNNRVEPFRFVDLSSDGVTCARGSVCILQNAMSAQVEHYSGFTLSPHVSGTFRLLTKRSTTGLHCAKLQMPRSQTNTPLQCSEAALLPSPISLCSRLPRVCDFTFRRIHIIYVAATWGCIGYLHVYTNPQKCAGCSLTISQQVSCST
jgi:hypothetical protein